MTFKKYTVEMTENLHRDLKVLAAKQGRPIREVLDEAITVYLETDQTE